MIGVLAVNLGTPDAPTTRAVRRYLKQFLSDPRVVELPRWLWWLVLNAFVLRVRPARSAALYRKVWTEEGSPMLRHSADLVSAIRDHLPSRLQESAAVELGMSYGQPSIEAALQKLYAQGIDRLVVLPLYPQYSGSTTGSVFDQVTRALGRRRRVPGLVFIDRYYDRASYIAAVAASIREFREQHGRGELLLFSFHGLPQKMVDNGDPYETQCRSTAGRVAESLRLDESEWDIAFQSRVGGQEWLKPYTDEKIESWGRKGMERIDTVCPGFAVDCLETLEEMAMRYGELFSAAGGGELRYIPALNDRRDHVECLGGLIAEAAARPPATSTGSSMPPAGTEPRRFERGSAT